MTTRRHAGGQGERICDDLRPVDRRKQGRPHRGVRELGVTWSEVEQHCRQCRAWVPEHPAVACLSQIAGHRGRETRYRIELPLAVRDGQLLGVVEELELHPGQVRHRPRRRARRSGRGERIGRHWRRPVAGHIGRKDRAGRDELGRVVAQAGDRERTRPDGLAAERPVGQLVRRDARRGCGPGRSAGSPPGGSHRAGS